MDMPSPSTWLAYSVTLANMRGILSDADYRRILDLFSRAGLSMDHLQFDEDVPDKGTKQIFKMRDGKLRLLNDVSMDEMFAALRKHKRYPHNGDGLDPFVDASDTGYTMNSRPVEESIASNGAARKKLVVPRRLRKRTCERHRQRRRRKGCAVQKGRDASGAERSRRPLEERGQLQEHQCAR